MKIRVPNYFKDFKCIASECEDTCCAGWGIVIDDETYNKYISVKGPFGDRLRSEIVVEGGENIFVLKGENCPFLNESKMCDIYNELGEDSLCYTCRQFPRFMEEFGNLREVGISLSCPEAARFILNNREKVTYELSENNHTISSYNEINGELFIQLLQCRKVIFDILQNRELHINYRAAITLCFVDEIQQKIDETSFRGIKDVREKYLDNEFIAQLMSELDEYKENQDAKYDNMLDTIIVFKDLKHINDEVPLSLNRVLSCFYQNEEDFEVYIEKHKMFNEYYQDNIYKFEQLLVYFVFRYFMKAVFDFDALAKVKTAVVSYLMIKEFMLIRWMENDYDLNDADVVDIMHSYSKDVEHLEENIETLAELFETKDALHIDEVLTTLLN